MTGEELKTKIEEFHEIMSEYSNFGATDTEPRWQFKNSIRKALIGERSVPSSARGWELYTNMEEAESASGVLTKECADLVDDILSSSIRDMDELIEAAKYYGYEPLG